MAWQYYETGLAKFSCFGQIFFVVNGQMLKNYLAIWSRCRALKPARGNIGRSRASRSHL